MTTDQPTYHMIAEHGRLVPAEPIDQERLDGFADGTEIECSMKPIKNGVLIRKLYGIVGLVIKQCETPWKKPDPAIQALKDSLGLAERGIGMHGQAIRYLRSLNDLSEYEMQEFMDGCWLLLRKLTGTDPLTLTKQSGDTAHGVSVPPDENQTEPSPGGIEGWSSALHQDSAVTANSEESQIDESGSASPMQDPSKEAGPAKPASDPSPRLRAEMITKLLRLAAEPLPADERLDALASTRKAWDELLDAGTVKSAFDTVAKVIRGELTTEAARRFLTS